MWKPSTLPYLGKIFIGFIAFLLEWDLSSSLPSFLSGDGQDKNSLSEFVTAKNDVVISVWPSSVYDRSNNLLHFLYNLFPFRNRLQRRGHSSLPHASDHQVQILQDLINVLEESHLLQKKCKKWHQHFVNWQLPLRSLVFLALFVSFLRRPLKFTRSHALLPVRAACPTRTSPRDFRPVDSLMVEKPGQDFSTKTTKETARIFGFLFSKASCL